MQAYGETIDIQMAEAKRLQPEPGFLQGRILRQGRKKRRGVFLIQIHHYLRIIKRDSEDLQTTMTQELVVIHVPYLEGRYMDCQTGCTSQRLVLLYIQTMGRESDILYNR